MAKAKGSTLIGAVKVLRTHKEKARKLLPESLHHYLEERISQASWYPEEDLLGLIRGVVDVMPGNRERVLEGMGVATARALGEGVYSHLVEGGGSVNGTFALWASMHDSGKLTVDEQNKGCATFKLAGYGHPSKEMCAITGAYMQETMRMGGRNARIEKKTCVLSGDDACTWEARW